MVRKNDQQNKTAALDLARRGFAVFPVHYVRPDGTCSCGEPNCKDIGKHPMTPNGCKDASTDPETVGRMFRGPRSSANIGVATGPASGVWVLDEDGPAGMAAIAKLEDEHGPLPQTVTVRTGRERGRHRYFAYPLGIEIKNRSKIKVPSTGKADIDVRGTGGYAIVPPSNHKSGRAYGWEHSPETMPIAEAPAWLIDLVREDSSQLRKNSQACPLMFTVAESVEDLATAPGAVGPDGDKPGNRHDTATRLIGGAIGRGTDPVLVAQQAVAWAQRCTPPLPDDEVLRIVNDLTRKQGSQFAAVQEQVEGFPLPEAIPWPELGDDAYYGLAGEIVRLIEPETEADPVAILAQLHVSFGNMVGRSAYYIVEGTSHHANVFMVLVGSTARGRKGTSEGRVKQVLRDVDEPWVLNNIKTGCVSGEGLIWNVRDPIHKTESVKKNGNIIGTEEVIADPGIEDKRLLVVEPEFAAVLRVCRREQNTLSPTIRSAWDSGVLRTLAKNSPAVATDAHVSIIGHITQEELHRALAEVECFSGFGNRFLWFMVRRSKLLPNGGQDLNLKIYAQKLILAAEQARSVERMHRDHGAAALWEKVYAELADDNAGGLLGAVTSRAEAQVLRLSMIYALLDGSGTITEQHLRAALAVWRYCRASARLIFGNASGDPIEERILAAIRANPGIGRTGIYQALDNHVKAPVLASVLARLRDAGKIRMVKLTDTGTKPVEQWFPCEFSELANLPAVWNNTDTTQPGMKFANSLSSQQDTATGPAQVQDNFANSQNSQASPGSEAAQPKGKFANSQSSQGQPSEPGLGEPGTGMEVFEL